MKFFEEAKEKNSSQETQKASLGIILVIKNGYKWYLSDRYDIMSGE